MQEYKNTTKMIKLMSWEKLTDLKIAQKMKRKTKLARSEKMMNMLIEGKWEFR
jgi:hypothetical protein